MELWQKKSSWSKHPPFWKPKSTFFFFLFHENRDNEPIIYNNISKTTTMWAEPSTKLYSGAGSETLCPCLSQQNNIVNFAGVPMNQKKCLSHLKMNVKKNSSKRYEIGPNRRRPTQEQKQMCLGKCPQQLVPKNFVKSILKRVWTVYLFFFCFVPTQFQILSQKMKHLPYHSHPKPRWKQPSQSRGYRSCLESATPPSCKFIPCSCTLWNDVSSSLPVRSLPHVSIINDLLWSKKQHWAKRWGTQVVCSNACQSSHPKKPEPKFRFLARQKCLSDRC